MEKVRLRLFYSLFVINPNDPLHIRFFQHLNIFHFMLSSRPISITAHAPYFVYYVYFRWNHTDSRSIIYIYFIHFDYSAVASRKSWVSRYGRIEAAPYFSHNHYSKAQYLYCCSALNVIDSTPVTYTAIIHLDFYLLFQFSRCEIWLRIVQTNGELNLF